MISGRKKQAGNRKASAPHEPGPGWKDGIDWDVLDGICATVAEDLSSFRNLSDMEYKRARLNWLTYGLIQRFRPQR
jgi:hypothetical protein